MKTRWTLVMRRLRSIINFPYPRWPTGDGVGKSFYSQTPKKNLRAPLDELDTSIGKAESDRGHIHRAALKQRYRARPQVRT